MGRVCQPSYQKRSPDGARTKVKTRAWYAEWQEGGKTRRKKIGSKPAATAALARFEEAATRRKHGLSDPTTEAAARARPLVEYLAEYRAVLSGKDTAPVYRANTDSQLTRILSECKWHTWTDVSADSLTAFLGRLRDRPQVRKLRGIAKRNAGVLNEHKPNRSGKGNAPATLNGYLRAAKAFARWLSKKVGGTSPLSDVPLYPEDVDRRRTRTILTDPELALLLAATAAAKHKWNCPVRGADRAMLYRLAAYTGLRAGELAELTPRHFALDAAPPVVTVCARDSKGKREEPIPLPAHVVELLRAWLAERPPTLRVFPGKWAERSHESNWLAWDLARAGVRAADDEGRKIHFHSLKRRFVVRLIQAGAKIHEVRRMARHVDVATTLKHYTDENLQDLGALADRLPAV